ncbi:hypothetical protein LguiB_031306 [Lonicera macranthoides]
MGKKRAVFLVLILVVSFGVFVRGTYDEGGDEREEEGRREKGGDDWFVLKDGKQVVKTEAGEVKVVKGYYGDKLINDRPMHIGFITMEPRSLFIPQYLDSTLILFIRRGEARVGSIYKDALAEQRLKHGDVYRIEAGSAFYLENIGEGQRLHVICSIDTSESLSWHSFQSFFIGGGTNPKSILSGFDPEILSTAFNVSTDELREIMTSQDSGAIVYISPDSHPPSMWTRFLELDQHEKLAHMKKIASFGKEPSDDEEEVRPSWSFRKLLPSIFRKDKSKDARKSDAKRTTKLDSYNLYDRRPDFRNDYGWSLALDESDYAPLGRSGVGVYLVNLTAGSMMAPHINPTATEYGIVLQGAGTIQIVYPNGTLAINTKVTMGDVFWVPRYFAFCQIASRTGPFEFFGFTTSAHKNHPQFLVGSNSLLHTMRGPELAASFGVSEDRFKKIIDAQREGVILPSASVAPPEMEVRVVDDEVEEKEIIPRLINGIRDDFMGF